MPTIQVAQFPVSEASSSQPDTFKGLLEAIKRADGHISSFYGVQVENKETGYFVSVWESHAHHLKLMEEPSYKSLVEVLKPATADTHKFERHHFDVTGDALTALSSPAVEFVVFTLKPGVAHEQVVPLFGELAKGLDAAVGAHPPCMWGPSLEDKNKIQVVVGWDTVEAHWEAVKEGTSLHGVIAKILELADLTIGHSLIKQL